MKIFGMGFIETAVAGVIGVGETGVVSRCIECRAWLEGDQRCNGFGQGCVARRESESGPSPAEKGK
jgi:hypothetical protein